MTLMRRLNFLGAFIPPINDLLLLRVFVIRRWRWRTRAFLSTATVAGGMPGAALPNLCMPMAGDEECSNPGG